MSALCSEGSRIISGSCLSPRGKYLQRAQAFLRHSNIRRRALAAVGLSARGGGSLCLAQAELISPTMEQLSTWTRCARPQAWERGCWVPSDARWTVNSIFHTAVSSLVNIFMGYRWLLILGPF